MNIRYFQEWRRKYETIKTDLNNSRYEKERIESENQTINTENIVCKIYIT